LQISLPSPVPPFFIYDFDLQHKRQPSSELTLSSPPLVEKNTQNMLRKDQVDSLFRLSPVFSLSLLVVFSLFLRASVRENHSNDDRKHAENQNVFLFALPPLFSNLSPFFPLSLFSLSLSSLSVPVLSSLLSLYFFPPLSASQKSASLLPSFSCNGAAGAAAAGGAAAGGAAAGAAGAFATGVAAASAFVATPSASAASEVFDFEPPPPPPSFAQSASSPRGFLTDTLGADTAGEAAVGGSGATAAGAGGAGGRCCCCCCCC
jgi:hypothetical protein